MSSKFHELLNDPKFRNFLRSPELAMLMLVFVSITIIMISTKKGPELPDNSIVPSVAEIEITETVTTYAAASETAAVTAAETETIIHYYWCCVHSLLLSI